MIKIYRLYRRIQGVMVYVVGSTLQGSSGSRSACCDIWCDFCCGRMVVSVFTKSEMALVLKGMLFSLLCSAGVDSSKEYVIICNIQLQFGCKSPPSRYRFTCPNCWSTLWNHEVDHLFYKRSTLRYLCLVNWIIFLF